MHAQLNIALRAARDGAVILARQFDRLDRVKEARGAAQQMITSAHLDVESAMLEQLRKTFPKHGYRSAATDLDEHNDSDTVWLLNPLVGTENFLRGTPGFFVSLACQVGKQISLALFIDPLLNEEFTAARGKGANLGGRRIRVSNTADLQNCVIAVEFARLPTAGTDPFDTQERLRAAGASQRTQGNEILDLLYTAAGRFDGGYISRPEPVALASAALILQEAGGLLSDTSGNPTLTGDSLVFGNPKCFKQLLKLAG